MNCFSPGQIIILPTDRNPDRAISMIREYSNRDVEVEYTAEDILKHYHLEKALPDLIERYGPLPFVSRVPEGEELAMASHFSKVKAVKSSIPNFFISPTGFVPSINTSFIDDALQITGTHHMTSKKHGSGIKIAILDTGIDPDILEYPEALFDCQYDSDICKTDMDHEDNIGHGSLVAYIINRISPAAQLLSVKVMGTTGTIGGLIAGLFLAEAEFKPDIYHLSLSLSCDPELCDVCGNPRTAAINAAQIRLLFDTFSNDRGRPLFVAAAGNNRKQISMPAAFPQSIAVGAYDIKNMREESYSRYVAVPTDRYYLAPGGNRTQNNEIATGSGWIRNHFFGTSFSAAFVSGILGRYLSLGEGNADVCFSACCYKKQDPYQYAVKLLMKSADSSWASYNDLQHGQGLVKYHSDAIHDILNDFEEASMPTSDQCFILVDTTGSMHSKLRHVAKHIESLYNEFDHETEFRLILYGDHQDDYTICLQYISRSSEDISRALLSAALTEGDDTPEALEDAMHFVNCEIDRLSPRNTTTIVYLDAPAHAKSQCPYHYDIDAEVNKMKSSGADIHVFFCKGDGSMTRKDINRLSEHSWQ